jgi:ammonium transporter, Amt family
MILWFGWYGFNPGSAFLNSDTQGDLLAMQAAATTTLAAASGGLSALFLEYFVTRRANTKGRGKYDLVSTMNGVLSGLVAVTGGCALIEPYAAVVIGLVAGVLYLASSKLLICCKLDDAVDATPVHMANGIWGMIAVSLFAKPELLEISYGRSDHPGLIYSGSGVNLLGAQCVGILFVIGWILVTMLPFFLFMQFLGIFRTAAMDEVHGLDKSYHGEGKFMAVQCVFWPGVGSRLLFYSRRSDCSSFVFFGLFGCGNAWNSFLFLYIFF